MKRKFLEIEFTMFRRSCHTMRVISIEDCFDRWSFWAIRLIPSKTRVSSVGQFWTLGYYLSNLTVDKRTKNNIYIIFRVNRMKSWSTQPSIEWLDTFIFCEKIRTKVSEDCTQWSYLGRLRKLSPHFFDDRWKTRKSLVTGRFDNMSFRWRPVH